MYRVSDEQIEFILDDIKKRGVEMEDLQLNLLDHVCCIMEREYNETDDFNTIYNTTIKQFFKTELWEIEEETIGLLHFKHYYKMKRFLYILLVLSIGFNIYIFSKVGYNYYQMKKWENHSEEIAKITFEEGYLDFLKKIQAQDTEIPKKKFIYVSFSGELWPWHPRYVDDEDVFSSEDSASISMNKSHKLTALLLIDSLAAIYNKNISYVYAYEGVGKKVDKIITDYKKVSKNIKFITNVEMLLKGYENDKKQVGRFMPTTFIIDASGKIVFASNVMTSYPEKKLITFLNSIE